MVHIIDNPQQMNQLCDALQDQRIIGIDTEFNSLDVYASTLLLISIAANGKKFVLDMTKLPLAELEKIRAVLESPNVLKVGHNLIAEYKQFYHHTRIAMRNLHDTLVADQLINAGLMMKFDLRSVAKRRLGIELDKTIRKEFIDWQPGQTFSQEQIEYSADDAVHPLQIYVDQMEDISEKGLQRVYELEMGIIPPTAMMEYTGVPINQQMLEEMIEPFQRFAHSADQAFQDILIESGAADIITFDRDGYTAVNIQSTDQVKAALAKIGIDVKDKSGKPTLDSKMIQRWDMLHSGKKDKHAYIDYHVLLSSDDSDIADALDNYQLINNKVLRAYAFSQGANKLVGTFILGLIEAINPKTKRIHPNFKSLGAHRTGRYSSTAPNFQNIPNDIKLEILGLGQYSIRKAIEAGKGRKLIIADYSGIELVILAVLSGDDKLMDQILHGDIHTYVVREIFKILDITDENKGNQPYKSWRQGAKRTSYSNAYGTTGRNLSDQLNIDLAKIGKKYTAKEGDEIINAWFALFPKTAAYLDANARQAVQQQYVVDSWGRRRNWDKNDLWFNGTERDRYWKKLAAGREGKNAPIQGTSATMTKLAILLLWQRLDMKKARIIITVHDEIVVEAVDSYVDTAKVIMKESMEQAIKETLPSIADLVGKYKSLSVDPKDSDRYDK